MSRLRLLSKIMSALLPCLLSMQVVAASSFEGLIDNSFTVPADYDSSVQIGMPFNLMSGDFRYYRCINAPYVEDGDNTEFETYVSTHGGSRGSISGGSTPSMSDLREDLAGDYDNLGVLNELYFSDANHALANLLQETDTSITGSYLFTLHSQTDAIAYRIYDQVVGLSEYCQQMLDSIAAEGDGESYAYSDILGTHIVSAIGYGARLFLHIKVDAQSPAEKELIKRYLSVGTWELTEGFEEIPESTMYNTSVEVFATHVGGEPNTFLKSLSNGLGNDAVIARCNLTNIKACADVFRTAGDEFADSLLDENGEVDRAKLVKIFYTLKPLSSFGLQDLVVDELKSHISVASGDLEEMLESYNAYGFKIIQVEEAIQTARKYDNADYLQYLFDLKSVFERGRVVLKEASKLCRKSYSNNECALIKQELYDSSISGHLNILSVSSEEFADLINSSAAEVIVGSTERLTLDGESIIELNWQVFGPDFSYCEYSVSDVNDQTLTEYDFANVVGSGIQKLQIKESSLLAGQSLDDSVSKAVLSISCRNLLSEGSEAETASIPLLEDV